MLRLILPACALLSAAASAANLPKCCPHTESVMLNETGRFRCSEPRPTRLQLLAGAPPAAGPCREVYNDEVWRFAALDATFRPAGRLRMAAPALPKCCPLHYAYNRTTHGCSRSPARLRPLAGEEHVRVGLADCLVVVDAALGGRLPAGGPLAAAGGDRFCVDRFAGSEEFVMRRCASDRVDCERRKCVKKCCPDGQSFLNGVNCVDTFVHGLDLAVFGERIENGDDEFSIITYRPTQPVYMLNFQHTFSLTASGVFRMLEADNKTHEYQLDEASYCIEYAYKNATNKVDYFGFFREIWTDPPPIKFMFTRIAMYISSFFLILTILYYLSSSELQTIFGKLLISYCCAMLASCLLYSYLSLDVPRGSQCEATAFMGYYLLMTVFTWTNVLSVDIYWTFGSFKSSSFRQKGKDLKRFLLYSLYGWGLPLFFTGLIIIFHSTKILPTSIAIQISEQHCLLKPKPGNYSKLIFILLYLTIVQLINLILFIKTAVCCLSVKKEISKMNDTNHLKGKERKRFNNIRDRFGLIIKLFLIMGMSFMFELVSMYCNFKANPVTYYIEIIWDTLVSLQGLFIFIIFILKKRILEKFRHKVGLRKLSSMSVNMTQSTALPPSKK